MPHKTLRFDVFAVVEWTAAIAFICALMAGAGGKAAWTTDFKSLPPNDTILLSWLEEKDRKDVTIARENNSVTLEVESGVFTGIFNSFSSLPEPPWPQLGYSAPQRMSGSTSWTLFSGSAYLWIVGFGLLILLGWIRRRYIKPNINGGKHKGDEDNGTSRYGTT